MTETQGLIVLIIVVIIAWIAAINYARKITLFCGKGVSHKKLQESKPEIWQRVRNFKRCKS